MKALLRLSAFSVIVLAGCSKVGTGRICDWQPSDEASPLDLSERSNQLHLMGEALRAEDLAVRYADIHRGKRSGQFAGGDAYLATREQCMAMAFDTLAKHHGVTTAQVRDSLLYRRKSVDGLILLLFVGLYVAATSAIVRWISDGALSEATLLRWVLTMLAACAVTAIGSGLFGLWVTTFEMIRIGNTHMSYRVARTPWSAHWGELLIGGAVLFLLVAAYWHARERANRVSATTTHAV
jgi:hypothetical protein